MLSAKHNLHKVDIWYLETCSNLSYHTG